MMATNTTRLSLYKPGGGSTGLILPDEIADIDKINGNMDLIDAAIGAKNVTSTTRPAVPFDGQIIRESDTLNVLIYSSAVVRWVPVGIPNAASATLRDALFPAPVSGNIVFRTDLNYAQRYTGTAWISATSGLVPMIASSTVNTAAGIGNLYNFTSQYGITLNGVFTSDYLRYLVRVQIQTAAGVQSLPYFRLVAAGVPATAANYTQQLLYGTGSTPATANQLNYNFWSVPGSGDYHKLTLELDGVAAPTITMMTQDFVDILGSTGAAYAGKGGGFQVASTAYDGLFLGSNSNQMTGSIQVFGLSN